MLENAKAFSGFAVDDLERAHQFYGGTLGLRTSEDNGLLTLHLAGSRDTLVYPKPDHVPGDALSSFGEADVQAKFIRLVAPVLGAAKAERVWTLALDALEQPAEAVREIGAVTTAAARPR